jgi:hypothetical protein
MREAWIWFLWFASVMGLLTLVRDALAIFKPDRFGTSKNLLWSYIRIAAIISAAIIVWRSTHREGLVGEAIGYTIVQPPPWQYPDRICVLMTVRLGNDGDPSIARDFKVSLDFPTGDHLEPSVFDMPDSLLVRDPSRGNRPFYGSDEIQEKTANDPIPSGGERTGYLLFCVSTQYADQSQAKGTVATVTFHGVRGTKYSFKYRPSGQNLKVWHVAPGTRNF